MAGSYYEVEVRPDASGWSAKLEAQIGEPMRRLAAEFQRRFSDAAKNAFDGIGGRLEANLDPAARRAADNLRDQLRRGLREGMNGTPGNSSRQGNQSGRQYADAFSREVKAKLEAAFRSLPDAPLGLNSSAADVEIASIREKLVAATKDIELGVDTGVVDARVEALQARLTALGANSTDVRVQVNTREALAQIEAFRAALANQGGQAADGFTDAFTRKVRARLTAAFESLPKLTIDANSSAVDREIAEIRTKLEGADNDIKLGVDSKTVNAELDLLRARLRALATGTTDIRVRANTGTALAELEALRRESSRFEDDDAKGGFFRRTLQNLNLIAPAAKNATGELGAVGGAASESGNNIYVMIGLVVALVAALSAVGPIVAGAFGGLVGLAGVAGVAGLALLGLKKQMAEQVGFGQQIQGQLKTIVAQVGGLGQVAANAIGPAIVDVLSLVKRVLPTFEPLVQLVGGRLGGSIRLLGTALVTGFQKAAPLIVDVASYLEQGAAALQRWVLSDSFNTFIDYARKNLPVIIKLAVDFGAALINLFVTLAPIGEGVLKLLDLIAVGFSKTAKYATALSPISLVASLFGGGGKTDTQKETDTLLDSFKAISTGAANTANATGALDNYKKVLGDLTPALQSASVNNAALAASVNGIDQRMRSAVPSVAAFVDAASSYDATSAKAADTAGLLGAALTASRGNALDYADAMVSADTATSGLAKAIHDNLKSVSKQGDLLGVSYVDSAGKFVAATGKYSEGSQAIITALQGQVKAATDAATATYTQVAATGDTVKAGNDALTVYKGLRQSFIDQALAAGGTTDQVGKLADKYFAVPKDVDTFVKLLGQQDVSTAIIGLTTALNRLSDFIGAPKVELNHTDFDNSTAKANSDLNYFGGRLAIPRAALDKSPFDSGMGQANNAIDRLTVRTAIPRVTANTGSFNSGIGQANNAMDRLGSRTASPSVGLNDNASGKLRTINSLIASLHDKTITINTRTGGQAIGDPSAYGNVFSQVGHYGQGGIVQKLAASVPHFAGGSENHVPQIAMPNGGVRVWAEPETQGEAYIPFALDRRARAEDILANVAQRFGSAVIPQQALAAIGALASSGGTQSSGTGLPSNVVVNVIDRDGSLLDKVRGEIVRADTSRAMGAGAGSSSQVR